MSKVKKSKSRLWEFIPPEGVPIHFTITSMGTRIGAQVIDLVFTFLIIFCLVRLLIATSILDWEAMGTLVILSAFLLRTPYYIFSELIWNGRTLGKRILKIRVINIEGRRLTPHQLAARNLMKEVEVFAPLALIVSFRSLSPWWQLLTLVWLAIIIIVPLTSRKRQRIGDIIAGTLVVENPTSALLPDLVVSSGVANTKTATFTFLPEQLEIYGRHELQTLEAILRDAHLLQMNDQMQLITQTIIRKINFQDILLPGQERLFLTEFYKVQREHLEKLRLFGTRRENKFHENEPSK